VIEYFLSPAKVDLFPTEGEVVCPLQPPWLRAWIDHT